MFTTDSIREALLRLHRSQEWLAEQIGVTPQYLSVLINAAPRWPSERRRKRMAQIRAVLERHGVGFTAAGRAFLQPSTTSGASPCPSS